VFTLEITESAERDLDRITDYLGVNLSDPPAALALLDEVDAVCEALENDPDLFPLCKDARLSDLGYHKAVVRSYIMIYETNERVVRVLRFFHTFEDYTNKL